MDFKLPEDMSDGRLYKQAGNSVCVSVIERIAEEIAKVVAGAPEDLDTLKEIATWIQNDTTGSVQMANDVETLKNKVSELEVKIAILETKIEYLEQNNGTASVSPDEVKEIIKNYLAGVENEVKVEANADNSKLTIGFADDAIFG